MKKKKAREEDDEIEMNQDDDAGAVVVDTSNSRDGLLCTLLRLNRSRCAGRCLSFARSSSDPT